MVTKSTGGYHSLEVEASRAIGWHDGFNMHISASSLTDPLVVFHERVHARIFQETADGFLHGVFLRLSKESTSGRAAKKFRHLSKVMFKRSRFAHEAAATYLGIKSLSTEEQRILAIQALPDEYKQYYRYLADFLDGQAHSTYFQYVLGNAITQAAFSSTAIKVFVDSNFELEGLGTQMYRPTARMRFIMAAIDGKQELWIQDVLRDVTKKASQLNLPLWNLDSENEWINIGERSHVSRVEALLGITSYEWLIHNHVIPILEEREAFSNVYPRLQMFLKEKGISATFAYRFDNWLNNPDRYQAQTVEADYNSGGATKIYSRPIRQLQDFDLPDGDNFLATAISNFLSSPYHRVIFLSDGQYPWRDPWYIEFGGIDPETGKFGIYEDCLRVRANVAFHTFDQLEDKRRVMAIIAMDGADLRPEPHHNRDRFFRVLPQESGSGVKIYPASGFTLDQLLVYWTGNWITLLPDEDEQEDKPRMATIGIRGRNLGEAVTKLALLDDHLLVFRILSPPAANLMQAYEDRLLELGTVARLEGEPQWEQYKSRVLVAARLVKELWRQL
jgi:hypothetical protein